MKRPVTLQDALIVCIAIALLKLAFFSSGEDTIGIVPSVHATGSIPEWKGSSRIVTTSDDGETTYVWDYDAKTEVRKYFIKDGKLHLTTFKIDKK